MRLDWIFLILGLDWVLEFFLLDFGGFCALDWILGEFVDWILFLGFFDWILGDFGGLDSIGFLRFWDCNGFWIGLDWIWGILGLDWNFGIGLDFGDFVGWIGLDWILGLEWNLGIFLIVFLGFDSIGFLYWIGSWGFGEFLDWIGLKFWGFLDCIGFFGLDGIFYLDWIGLGWIGFWDWRIGLDVGIFLLD